MSDETKSDPFLVEIICIAENEDGSADIDFLLGSEALKKFAAIGIVATLKDAVKDLKDGIGILHIDSGEI